MANILIQYVKYIRETKILIKEAFFFAYKVVCWQSNSNKKPLNQNNEQVTQKITKIYASFRLLASPKWHKSIQFSAEFKWSAYTAYAKQECQYLNSTTDSNRVKVTPGLYLVKLHFSAGLSHSFSTSFQFCRSVTMLYDTILFNSVHCLMYD